MGEQLWMPTTKFKLKLETKLKLKLTHGLMLTPTTIPGGRMKVSRTLTDDDTPLSELSKTTKQAQLRQITLFVNPYPNPNPNPNPYTTHTLVHPLPYRPIPKPEPKPEPQPEPQPQPTPNLRYWLVNHKPLKNESAEDFAKRCMILLERGLEDPNPNPSTPILSHIITSNPNCRTKGDCAQGSRGRPLQIRRPTT